MLLASRRPWIVPCDVAVPCAIQNELDERGVATLANNGCQCVVLTAPSAPDALQILQTTAVDLVVTDIKMPRVSGLDLVRHVRDNLKDTEVTVITGHPNVDGAVAAMKNGATGYLTKPFTDAALLSAVRRAIDKLELRRAGGRRDQAPELPDNDHGRWNSGRLSKILGPGNLWSAR